MTLSRLNYALLFAIVLAWACSDGRPFIRPDGGQGGTPGAAGQSATGGATPPGGTGGILAGTGGSGSGGSGSGGATAGSGGSAGSGGLPATGGATAGSGGSAGAGGRVTASGGTVGSGGRAGAGGVPVGTGGGSGGMPASGGVTAASGGRPASGGSSGAGGGPPGSGGAPPGSGGATVMRPNGPCDLYATAGTPCAAAYSTIRGLKKGYVGPLYQVRNMSSAMNTGAGGGTMDIFMAADGFANTAPQDTFCAGTTCTVSILYDHSGNMNHLKVAPKGSTNGGMYSGMDDFESSATKGMLTVGGHRVYALYMAAREGYRLTAKGVGMPLGNTSQGIYMLADGTHAGMACCWDFGNVSTDPLVYGISTALVLGKGYWGTGVAPAPWFLADFEAGLWAGGTTAMGVEQNMNNISMAVPFALGMLKTSPGQYALRMADVKTATALTTAYDGASPKTWNNAGGIVLGVTSDNSNNSWGTFYEGAIINGLPSNATDMAVMSNIQAVGY